jgi:ribosomal protein S27AE
MPAIFCPDYKTAVFVRLVLGKRLDLRNRLSKSVKFCPRCGKHFVQSHPKQEYDTPKCREAHRVARWRAKQRGTVEPERLAKSRKKRKQNVDLQKG